MQTYHSTTLIDSLQEQTEGFLKKAVSEWQMAAPAVLLRQPGENKWSAAQCIEHLNSYGHYYLPAIENAIKNAQQNNWTAMEKFSPGRLGDYFTRLMMPETEGRKMKKMSAPKNHSPMVDLDSDKVVREFIDQQEKMLALLEQAREIDIQKAKVPISIAKFIRLRLGDVFRFLIAHNYRHIVQAERAAAGLKTEAAVAMGEDRISS